MGTILVVIGIVLFFYLVLCALIGFVTKEVEGRALAKNYADAMEAPFAFNDEDAEWIKHVLNLAGIEPKVDVLCGCGYGRECAMHCNHELFPDKCPGPSYDFSKDVVVFDSKACYDDFIIQNETVRK